EERPNRARGLIVDGHLDISGAAGGQGEAERGAAFCRLRQVEGDGPGRAIGPVGAGALAVVPVGAGVAFADDKVHVVWEVFRVFVVESPLPVMVAVAEFGSGAIGDADLPKLLAMAD